MGKLKGNGPCPGLRKAYGIGTVICGSVDAPLRHSLDESRVP